MEFQDIKIVTPYIISLIVFKYKVLKFKCTLSKMYFLYFIHNVLLLSLTEKY